MCPVFLPPALVPLWQSKQLAVTPVWSKRAGFHAVVEWQLSQVLSLATWSWFLPVAVRPSWHE